MIPPSQFVRRARQGHKRKAQHAGFVAAPQLHLQLTDARVADFVRASVNTDESILHCLLPRFLILKPNRYRQIVRGTALGVGSDHQEFKYPGIGRRLARFKHDIDAIPCLRSHYKRRFAADASGACQKYEWEQPARHDAGFANARRYSVKTRNSCSDSGRTPFCAMRFCMRNSTPGQ